MTGEPAQPRTGLLLVLGVAWLAAILWVAHAAIMADTVLALTTAAIALPKVIATSLVAGAIAGLATVTTLATRRPGLIDGLPARVGFALGAGLLTGGLGSVGILLTFGTQRSVATLAAAVAVAGALGGALGAVRPAVMAAAGLTAALGVLVIGFVLRLYQDELLSLYGAGPDPASWESAGGYYLLTDALVGGLTGGLIAYWHLRGSQRGVESPLRWPAYLVAGGAAGGLLLLAEAITQIGGRPLIRLASSVSDLDRALLLDAGVARLKYGLVVLFLGAIAAMIAFGRTLPKRPRDIDDVAGEDPEPATARSTEG